MPYADPKKRAEYALAAQKKYAAKYPERIKERSRKWYRENTEYARLKTAAWRAKKRGLPPPPGFVPRGKPWVGLGPRNAYGLTKPQYDSLRRIQEHACALCGASGILLHVDHEHVPGFEQIPAPERHRHVRGLLCKTCNVFLGMSGDDPAIIKTRAAMIAARIEAYIAARPAIGLTP